MTTHTLSSLLSLAQTPEGLQQLRVMVAEACGWVKMQKLGIHMQPHEGFINPSGSHVTDLPHYTTSLDAMASALRDKDDAFMRRFRSNLFETYRAEWDESKANTSLWEYGCFRALKPDAWRWAIAFVLASQEVPA